MKSKHVFITDVTCLLITAGTSEAQPVPKMQNAEEVGKAVYVGELIRQPGIDSNCFH